jgi:streptogramin lyase
MKPTPTSLFVAMALLIAHLAHAQTISVVAGNGTAGYRGDGQAAASALLNQPFGVVRGIDGALYFCDTNNHAIRRIDANGVITTVAGTGIRGYAGDGGLATLAQLNEPYELRFDRAGNLYFVERLNHVVRRVDAKTKQISTIAGTGTAGFSGDGGLATKAQLNQPHSLQFDADGNLLIADVSNQRVRLLNLKTGIVRTFAGTGEKLPTPDRAPIQGTPLNGPRAIDVAPDGDIWLALREGNVVLRFDAKTGTIRHVAGTGATGFTGNGGPATLATLSGPKGLSLAPNGDVYLADTESHSVRKIDARTGNLELVAGTGKRATVPGTTCAAGDPLRCEMARPHGVFVDADGTIFIGDSETNRVLAIRPAQEPMEQAR